MRFRKNTQNKILDKEKNATEPDTPIDWVNVNVLVWFFNSFLANHKENFMCPNDIAVCEHAFAAANEILFRSIPLDLCFAPGEKKKCKTYIHKSFRIKKKQSAHCKCTYMKTELISWLPKERRVHHFRLVDMVQERETGTDEDMNYLVNVNV